MESTLHFERGDAISPQAYCQGREFIHAPHESATVSRPNRIRAFIIHLPRAIEREAQVLRLIAELPVGAEVIEAVDGRMLTPEEVDSTYARHLHRPRYPFRMSMAEIACFLSHRRAWAAIVDQGLDAGLVIEDDVALDATFAAAFSAACGCLTPGAFIRFPFRANRERGVAVHVHGGATVIRPERVGLGMVAQLVSRDAAIHLLRKTEVFDRPVDTTLQLCWALDMSPLAVLPGGVREISSTLGGSTIVSRKSLAERLSRELLRPLYRAKVALHSRSRG